MKKDYKYYRNEMEECVLNQDYEAAHCRADDLLCEICLSEISIEEKRILVSMYEEVGKWYA